MELRAPSPSLVLRRSLATFRRDRLGLEPTEPGQTGLALRDREAVTYWLHHGLTPGEVAAAIGLAEHHIVRYLLRVCGEEWKAASDRARSVAPAGRRQHEVRQQAR